MNPRHPLSRDQALRIMLDYIAARTQVATVDELRSARRELDAVLVSGALDQHQGAADIVKGLSELVFVEAQLRDEDVETQLRRLLDEHGFS
jgi:hypothetical protein